MSRLSRRERRNILGLFVLCAIPLGAAIFYSRVSAIPDIELEPLAALPTPNGFDLYAQAGRTFVAPNPPVDAWDDPYPVGEKAATERYSLARRQGCLRANAAAFALFDRAGRAQTRHPDPAIDIGGRYIQGRAVPGFQYGANYGQYFSLARYKRVQVTTLLLQKRPAAALDSALDVVQMSFDLRRGAHYQGSYFLPMLTWVALQPIQTASGAPEQLDASEARVSIARIDKLLARRPQFADCVALTHRQITAGLRDLWTKPNWREGALYILHDPQKPASSADKWHVRLLAPGEILSNVNNYYDEAERVARQPYSHRIAQMPKPPQEPVSAYSCAPFSADFIFDQTKEKVALDLLLLRLALRAHKLETGSLPATLDALKGAYLTRVPTDDFADGAPYHYQRSKGDYKLWSVGPNRVNDGGKPAPQTAKSMVTSGNHQSLQPGLSLKSPGDYVAGIND